MTTVDQFLEALAEVESSNNPEAWGDGGRAMGRWQVHPDRLWQELHARTMTPQLHETWDHLVCRVVSALFNANAIRYDPIKIAMNWHLGHWSTRADDTWDDDYASRIAAALARAGGGAS